MGKKKIKVRLVAQGLEEDSSEILKESPTLLALKKVLDLFLQSWHPTDGPGDNTGI